MDGIFGPRRLVGSTTAEISGASTPSGLPLRKASVTVLRPGGGGSTFEASDLEYGPFGLVLTKSYTGQRSLKLITDRVFYPWAQVHSVKHNLK